MGFWIALWTVTWVVGLAVFTGLSLGVRVYRARDIPALFRSLRPQHRAPDDKSFQ